METKEAPRVPVVQKPLLLIRVNYRCQRGDSPSHLPVPGHKEPVQFNRTLTLSPCKRLPLGTLQSPEVQGCGHIVCAETPWSGLTIREVPWLDALLCELVCL